MRLILCERQELEQPEVTVAYREMTEEVKRVSEFVRCVDRTILCRKETVEYTIPVSEIYYAESVDKKTFVYCEREVYQCSYKLYELEELLPRGSFVRVSKSTILNIEMLKGVKTLVNSKLEAILSNGEHICVTRNYLKEIKETLLRRNNG